MTVAPLSKKLPWRGKVSGDLKQGKDLSDSWLRVQGKIASRFFGKSQGKE